MRHIRNDESNCFNLFDVILRLKFVFQFFLAMRLNKQPPIRESVYACVCIQRFLMNAFRYQDMQYLGKFIL